MSININLNRSTLRNWNLFRQFPNSVTPVQFIKFVQIYSKRTDLPSVAGNYLLKISFRNPRNRKNNSIHSAGYEEVLESIYHNIRQIDFWTRCLNAVYIHFLDCTISEIEFCKMRLRKTLTGNGLPAEIKSSLQFEVVSISKAVDIIQHYVNASDIKCEEDIYPFDNVLLLNKFLKNGRFNNYALPLPVTDDLYHMRFSPVQRFFKRSLDIFLSTLAIIFFLPLMLIISVAIFADNPGPVLFRQRRIGYQGIPFFIYKFRTMKAEKDNSPEHRDLINKIISPGDEKEHIRNLYQNYINYRITRVGKWLRKMSLDELPQLFNILKNDMSLVGPRPHPEYEVEKYRNWYHQRLFVKPGLTGLSKVEMRNSVENYEDSFRLDIRYIKQWSLWLDIKIIFKTAGVLLIHYE